MPESPKPTLCVCVCVYSSCVSLKSGSLSGKGSHGNRGCSVSPCPRTVLTGLRGVCDPHNPQPHPALSSSTLTVSALCPLFLVLHPSDVSSQDVPTATNADWWWALDAASLHGETEHHYTTVCQHYSLNQSLELRFKLHLLRPTFHMT